MIKFDKNKYSIEEIIKETIENLKTKKNTPSPSKAWDCYCYIYGDDIQIGNSSCEKIKDKERKH